MEAAGSSEAFTLYGKLNGVIPEDHNFGVTLGCFSLLEQIFSVNLKR
jgi:hypothetical protein